MPAHLAVRRTPDAGEGLFATAPIEEGHIVGFYTGEAFPEAAFDARHDAAARELYAMVVELASQMRVVLSPVSSSTGSLEAELRQHPLAAANEPRAGDRANTLMVHLEVDPAALTGAVRRSVRAALRDQGRVSQPSRVHLCVLVACRDVAADEELTWHYGDAYAALRRQRGYDVGEPGWIDERRTADPYALLRRWKAPVPADAIVPSVSTKETLERDPVGDGDEAACGSCRRTSWR